MHFNNIVGCLRIATILPIANVLLHHTTKFEKMSCLMETCLTETCKKNLKLCLFLFTFFDLFKLRFSLLKNLMATSKIPLLQCCIPHKNFYASLGSSFHASLPNTFGKQLGPPSKALMVDLHVHLLQQVNKTSATNKTPLTEIKLKNFSLPKSFTQLWYQKWCWASPWKT